MRISPLGLAMDALACALTIPVAMLTVACPASNSLGSRAGNAGGPASGGSASSVQVSPAEGAQAFSPCPPKGAPCVIMPLGDSITEGALSSHGGGYRLPLFRLAHRDGKLITFVGDARRNGPTTVDGVPFPTAHEGHGGFTIDPGVRPGLSPLIQRSMLKHRPHVITLMIGTNDVGVGVDALAERLGNLVDKIVTTDPNVLLVIAQIVPTAFADDNVRVRAYNGEVAAVAKSRAQSGKHVVLVDMYNPFVDAPGFPGSVLADDLHPNDAGYALLARVWYDALKPMLP